MRTIIWLSLIFISFGVGLQLLLTPHNSPLTAPSSAVLPSPHTEKDIHRNSYKLEQSVVHVLLIPTASRFLVTSAFSHQLDTLEGFVQKHQALAAINGGFFDPQNRKSTSIVIQQESLVADPRQNERLMHNPKLAPYLNKILNRTEFRRYRCGSSIRYDIALHTEPTPPSCVLVDAMGGGPRLLPQLTAVEEGFLDVANGSVIRDSLNSRQPNARSAIGITHEGSILLVMVAQKPENPATSGMSLSTLAAFLKTLGVEKAMNLDGGSSSSLYYQGKTIDGKVNEKGNAVRRNVFSVLLVQKMSE